MNDIQKWSIQKSSTTYGLENWGRPYFSINDKGHIQVTPDGESGPSVDMFELVEAVKARDIDLPVLFRFNGILRHRVRELYSAFQGAISEFSFKGSYFPAYPIKVNQQRQVVDVLRQAGSEVSMGIEVGSKPELIAVLAIHDDPNGLLLCNGYKDAEYLELALLSIKVGRRPIIIIEKYSEIALVLSIAEKLGVQPEIGFRLRLAGRGSGRWENSGGDRAKFGLTISEVLTALGELGRAEKLGIVKLLHFHIGSQVTSIASFRTALKEAGQVYVQLRRRCPGLEFVDVGGGLGVDYDGSKTNFESSMNYSVQEYARDIVWILQEISDKGEVPHPNIITESGRAMVAHHSVLVFNVLGIANTFSYRVDPAKVIKSTEHKTVLALAELLTELSPKNCHECLHDALALRQDMLDQFTLGLMSVEDRALGDETYWTLLNAICRESKALNYIPEDLERLPALLTDNFFCNLSVFQSMPDSWAIQQIFPVTPVHRLNEEPTEKVVLADITCDSDGKIDRFADLRDVKRYLPAHKLNNGEDYYLATFLVGAYQEILGDLHNLFGDTNAVHVEVESNGRFDLTHMVAGDTVRDVLRYVQYDREDLCKRWRTAIETAIANGRIPPSVAGEIFKKYASSFEGYTYLESE